MAAKPLNCSDQDSVYKSACVCIIVCMSKSACACVHVHVSVFKGYFGNKTLPPNNYSLNYKQKTDN